MNSAGGVRTFTYENRQQMKTDGVLTFGWDDQDRMSSAAVNAYPTYTVSYLYDALGRRVFREEQRSRNGKQVKVAILLSYDGSHLIEEFDRDGLVRRTTWGAVGAPIAVESKTFVSSESGGNGSFYGEWYGDLVPYILVTASDGSVVGVLDGDGKFKEKLVYNSSGLARAVGVENAPLQRGSNLVPFAWQSRFLEPITNRLWNGSDFDPLHGQRLIGDIGYNPGSWLVPGTEGWKELSRRSMGATRAGAAIFGGVMTWELGPGAWALAADQAYAGFKEAFTGKGAQTFLNQGLSRAWG